MDFINELDSGTRTLEVGCGNGKNLNLRDDIDFHGCDISKGLIEICEERKFNVKLCDGCDLDYEDDYFDSSYSIAVLHHMSNDERRIKFLSEMVRVTKNNGKIFFQVWATSEPKYKKSKSFNENILDKLVIFKDDGKEYERYYHFFDKDEIIRLIKLFNDTCDETIKGEISFCKNNWIFSGRLIK